MKHQQAILAQRLESIRIGIKQAEAYLGGVSSMIMQKEVDMVKVNEEVEEIRTFLLWLQGNG